MRNLLLLPLLLMFVSPPQNTADTAGWFCRSGARFQVVQEPSGTGEAQSELVSTTAPAMIPENKNYRATPGSIIP